MQLMLGNQHNEGKKQNGNRQGSSKNTGKFSKSKKSNQSMTLGY